MNDPQKRDEKCSVRKKVRPLGEAMTERFEEANQQKVEQETAAHVPEQTRQVITERVRVPDEIVEEVGDVLDRPVMRGGTVESEIMAERFRKKERTLDERIVPDQRGVIPNQLSGKSGDVHRNAKDGEEKTPNPAWPGAFEESGEQRHGCSASDARTALQFRCRSERASALNWETCARAARASSCRPIFSRTSESKRYWRG